MTKRRITIIGNSVSLRVRPKTEQDVSKIYSFLLEKQLNNVGLWEVVNLGKSRYLSSEYWGDKDLILATGADYYIINLGCVDAPPREIPLWFSDIIFKRKNEFLFPFFDFIYKHFIKAYLRKIFVKIRNSKPWVGISKFEENMSNMILDLRNNSETKIIILGINKGNDRIERALPGINESYLQYNKILKQLAIKLKCQFIDVRDLDSELHFPDGVHYNELGHKIISQRLMNTILKR